MPVPDIALNAHRFMGWLDCMSMDVKCPVVFIRGNQQTTLTAEL